MTYLSITDSSHFGKTRVEIFCKTVEILEMTKVLTPGSRPKTQ